MLTCPSTNPHIGFAHITEIQLQLMKKKNYTDNDKGDQNHAPNVTDLPLHPVISNIDVATYK